MTQKRSENIYLKVKRTTETGQKLDALNKRYTEAFRAARAFSEKYGFTSFRPGQGEWVGMAECLNFEQPPDRNIWGKVARKEEYFPKRSTPEGKAVWEEMNALPSVRYQEIHDAVGFNHPYFWKCLGIAFTDTEYVGLISGEGWFEPPADCEEITITEYKKLFHNEKEEAEQTNA